MSNDHSSTPAALTAGQSSDHGQSVVIGSGGGFGSVFDRTSNFYPTERTDLPENTRELLLTLHFEFYNGPKADADAFRILPRVINALEKAGAIPPLPNTEMSHGSAAKTKPL